MLCDVLTGHVTASLKPAHFPFYYFLLLGAGMYISIIHIILVVQHSWSGAPGFFGARIGRPTRRPSGTALSRSTARTG